MALSPRDHAVLWWKTLSPKWKQRIKFGSLAVGVVGAVVIGAQISGRGQSAQEAAKLKKAEEVKSQVFVEHPTSTTPKEMQAQIDALKDQVKRLVKLESETTGIKQNQIQDLSKHLSAHLLQQLQEEREQGTLPATGLPENSPQLTALQNQIAELQSQIAALHNQPQSMPQAPGPQFYPAETPMVLGQPQPAATPGTTTGAPEPSNGIPPAPAAPKAPTVGANLQHVHTLKQAANVVTVKSQKGIYLPAGTILSGVLLTGLQAETGPKAKSNPQIVDIRVKRRAILPNGVRANFSSCFVIASGYGSLATRRVYLRSNMLSCVERRSGKVITAPVKAEIESGGLLGVPGKVISHQGPVILKSLLAGIFSGLGEAAQPTGVQGLNINPVSGSQQSFQSFNPAYLGESALAGGISTPAGEISKFYLHEAEALVPTIQINPGVAVDLFTVAGTTIHTNGETQAQIAQANYQGVSEMQNQAMPQQQGPYGTQSPYAGGGQSPAVAAAFPNRQTVEREEQAGQQPNIEGQP